MPTQDTNKSLDERSDNIVNVTNKETGGNGQSNQKAVKKKMYTIGDSMVKHIKRWNLSNKLDQTYNIYVPNFPGAKGRIIEDYTKPCTIEGNLDHIILHVGTKELKDTHRENIPSDKTKLPTQIMNMRV